jgi:hypothetical protein
MSEKNCIPKKPNIFIFEKLGVRIHLGSTRPSPIQTVLSALESHQILPFNRLAGLEFLHHRRLGISPDPEGLK